MALKLGSNPLLAKGKTISTEEKEVVVKEAVKQYGRLAHLRHDLLKKVDFDDRSYINRFFVENSDLELEDLKESIKKVGLINIIYLQELDDSKFRLISGLRRSASCLELYEEGFDVKGKDRVVIFNKEVPDEILDLISVDENLKRKDLTILEQSYKFNREANKKNKSVEEILIEYNISKKSFYRVKKAIFYPDPIREIIEDIGVEKAELLNQIKEISGYNASQVVKKYKDFKRDELREILKEFKYKMKKEKIELKHTKKSLNLKLNMEIDEKILDYFKNIAKMIEDDDFSFLS